MADFGRDACHDQISVEGRSDAIILKAPRDVKSKEQEARKRCAIVGRWPRAVFSGERFLQAAGSIVGETEKHSLLTYGRLMCVIRTDVLLVSQFRSTPERTQLADVNPRSPEYRQLLRAVEEAKPVVKIFVAKSERRKAL